jgi:Ca-activated chloride channel family protein
MSSPSSVPVTLSAEFDRALVWETGRSVRYLGVGLSATVPATAKPKQRPAINLAVVIDASGSMSGGRLDAARAAALGLIERLSERDVLSVVSFASDVVTHVNALPLNADNKRTAARAIEELVTRGSTNLAAGWQRGAECAAAYNHARPGHHSRVLLLSDGHANQGLTDPRELGRIAENWCGRGVSTSAVGIGAGYSAAQIESIAGNGGGQVHHADTPADIVEVVLGELGDLAGTVAENLVVEVAHSPGVKVELLGEFPLAQQDHQIRCSVGSLISNRPRRVVFKVTAPAGVPGDQLPFHVRAQWNPAGSTALQTASAPAAVLTFAEESANNAQFRNVSLSVEVARVWQGFVMQRAVQLNREGVVDQARQLVETELGYLERYCHGLPGTETLLNELRTFLADAARPMEEAKRKAYGNIAWKNTRQEIDHRSSQQSKP